MSEEISDEVLVMPLWVKIVFGVIAVALILSVVL